MERLCTDLGRRTSLGELSQPRAAVDTTFARLHKIIIT